MKVRNHKIYNEIIIDMNPESPSFEQVLYEDSELYSGDLALAATANACESVARDLVIVGYYGNNWPIIEDDTCAAGVSFTITYTDTI